MSTSAATDFPMRPLSRQEAVTEKRPCAGTVAPLAEVSDEILVAHICANDPGALAILFERYAKLTRSVAFRILGDVAEADDLVQDLFLFLQRKCEIYDSSKSSARSWIVQMAYHRALDRRRYLKARRFYTETSIQESGLHLVGTPTTEGDYSPEVVFGRNGLEKILQSLSVDQRETLRLYFFEGCTLAEVSQKIGQPLGNVRHYYYRALDKLRKQMFANNLQPGESYVNKS